MKVYVDKDKLETHDIQSITDLGGKEKKQVRMWFENTDNVEIKDIAEYTKQVRKEVCEEIRKLTIKRNNDQFYIMVQEILDQIQGDPK